MARLVTHYIKNNVQYNIIYENTTDVEIHDLVLGTDEFIAVGTHWNTWVRDTFNAPVPFEFATDNNLDPVGESIYTGNAWTDCVVALRKFSQDWWYLGRLAMPDDIIKWAESGKSFDEMVSVNNECNFDALGHVAKGVIGIRAEYLENSEINDLKIHNLMNVGDLGSSKCGSYKDGTDGGMPLQDKVTNIGYGGTTSRAISMYGVKSTKFNSLEIENVMSLNGPSHGLFFITDNEVEISDANMKHIQSGIGNSEDYSKHNWPNPANEACAVSWVTEDSIASFDSISSKCISGHIGCMRCADSLGSREFGSCSGEILECEESTSYTTPIGTFGVGSDGSIEVTEIDIGESESSSSSLSASITSEAISAQSSKVNYISVINNPLFTETSKLVQFHKEMYIKSGGNNKKNEKWFALSKPSEHIWIAAFLWIVFMLIMGYVAYTLKAKNQAKKGNILRFAENDEFDHMTLGEYWKQRFEEFKDEMTQKWNKMRGNIVVNYDEIDQVTRVNYQEREFFMPS